MSYEYGVGPGWVFHLSTEDGFQKERAEHRTWRLGLLFAVRTYDYIIKAA